MWLLGKLAPDFKTIADFRRDNLAALKGVCREFTLLCRKLKLFGGELVAIDGSKFKGVNNRRRNFNEARLTHAIKALEAKIDGYLDSLRCVLSGVRPSILRFSIVGLPTTREGGIEESKA